MALIRVASIRRNMNVRVVHVLACLVYCSCGHLTLLPHPALVHALPPSAPMAGAQIQHRHGDDEQLRPADVHVFDTVRLFPHAGRARSHDAPQQHRPNRASGFPVANNASPGLGDRGVPQHSQHSRTDDASPRIRPRRQQKQQQQQRSGGLDQSGAAGADGEDAVLTGLASAELQAAFQAEYDLYTDAYDDFDGPLETAGGTSASRKLLQGRRRPSQYHKCPRCTLSRCDTTKCLGRCRRNRKLFDCRTNPRSRSAARCIPDENVIVAELPISALDSHNRLAVTAPSPYIGCALIADQAAQQSGCPAPGTRGQIRIPGRSTQTAFEVGSSTCAFQRYDPVCGPNYPFGVCLCSRIALDGASLPAGPCNITELDIVNSPPARGEEPVVIESRGNVTYTGYSDYGETDHMVAGYELSMTEAALTASINSMPELFEGVSDVSVALGGVVEVTLEVFEVSQDTADEDRVYELAEEAEVAVSADYYDEPDEPTAAIGRAVAVRREPVRVPVPRHPACDLTDPYDRDPVYYDYYNCYSYDYDYDYAYVQYYRD